MLSQNCPFVFFGILSQYSMSFSFQISNVKHMLYIESYVCFFTEHVCCSNFEDKNLTSRTIINKLEQSNK